MDESRLSKLREEDLPDDPGELRRLLLKERAARLDAVAKRSAEAALVAEMKLTIEKLKHELYGQRSERTVRLLDQM